MTIVAAKAEVSLKPGPSKIDLLRRKSTNLVYQYRGICGAMLWNGHEVAV